MTAPPTQMPLLAFSDAQSHAGTAPADYSYLTPASTASDSPSAWPVMASQQPADASSEDTKAPSNALVFIHGTTLENMRSRENMNRVRKQAMTYHLAGKKPRAPAKSRQPRSREGSASSQTSAGANQQDFMSKDEVLKMLKPNGKRTAAHQPSQPTQPETERPDPPVMQLLPLRPTVGFILDSAPIVQAMRTDVVLPYDSFTPGPLQSLGRPFDPFRAMYQASHPRVSVEMLKFHCSRSFGTRAMGIYWIPALITSPHAFLSTLCIASAHYDAINDRPVESIQTVALSTEVMHLIGRNILNPPAGVDDSNIIALTQLIASEIITGAENDKGEEQVLGYHEAGVRTMIRSRGGIQQLGLNGRLASTVSWVSLESAILREAKPQNIYSDYCAAASSKNYPNTATVPESPLYCPRPEFETIRRSQRCTKDTMELLKEIRMMMDLFVHETKQSRQNPSSLKNIYKKITSGSHFPSAADLQKTNVLTPNDWKYEAVRIACIITASAIYLRKPLSEALGHAAGIENPTSFYTSSPASASNESLASLTNLRHDSPITSFSTSPSYATAASPAFQSSNFFAPTPPRPSFSSTTSEFSFFPVPQAPTLTGPIPLLTSLKTAIQNSDLSDCWGDMAGVLLWVSLTVGAASRKSDRVLRKWFRALAMRASILLCFEHPEAVHASLLRMGDVIEGLGYATSRANTEVVSRDSAAGSMKRKRM